MTGRRFARTLPPQGEKTLLAILWPRADGGWEGRVKRLQDGKEVYVKDLEALLKLLEEEEGRGT